MPVALPALELVAWLTFGVVLILAVTIKFWLTPLFAVIDHTIGHIPYVGGKIKGGEEAVLSSLEGVISASRSAMTTLLQGVKWSVNVLIDGVRDFSDEVAHNWKLLIESAIPGALGLLYASLHTQVASALKRLDNLAGTVASNLLEAEHYADKAVAGAISSTERYADGLVSDVRDWTSGRVHDARLAVEGELADVTAAVTKYVDISIGGLRKAEDEAVSAARAAAATALATARKELDSAIGTVAGEVDALARTLEGELAGVKSGAAVALAAAANELRAGISAGVTDAENLASSALTTAEATLEGDLSHVANAAASSLAAAAATLQGAIGQVASAEQATVAGISAAEHAAAGELADIYNLPADAIKDLLDRLDLTKLLGFGAGIVLVKALVEAIATESGLEDATCRAKHKQVCGVDPSEWTGLLEGAAFLTGALSLAEILPIARFTFHELTDLIGQAA